MKWQDILKANCGTHKEEYDEEEKKELVGNQKKIDANKDGKITGEDFAMLRDDEKKGKVKCPKCDGKGCNHCNGTGYHESKKRSAFTAED